MGSQMIVKAKYYLEIVKTSVSLSPVGCLSVDLVAVNIS